LNWQQSITSQDGKTGLLEYANAAFRVPWLVDGVYYSDYNKAKRTGSIAYEQNQDRPQNATLRPVVMHGNITGYGFLHAFPWASC
jgi:hypothetical protein